MKVFTVLIQAAFKREPKSKEKSLKDFSKQLDSNLVLNYNISGALKCEPSSKKGLR
jgi:hypothetical protein